MSGKRSPTADPEERDRDHRGNRFAESVRYLRSYPAELPVLADLLPRIDTPVQVIAGAGDTAVPPVNASFLHERLPHSKLDIIDAGHFTWEDARRPLKLGCHLLIRPGGGLRPVPGPPVRVSRRVGRFRQRLMHLLSFPDFVGGQLRCWEVNGCAGYLVGGNGKRRMSAASASRLTTMRSRNEATAPTVAAIMAGDWSNSWPRRA